MRNEADVTLESKQPQTVLTTNKTEAGVDANDQLVYFFIRKTKWLALVMFLTQGSRNYLKLWSASSMQ